MNGLSSGGMIPKNKEFIINTFPETITYSEKSSFPSLQDTARQKDQAKITLPKTSQYQSRYQLWRAEQNLLVDTSRYIKPRNLTSLSQTGKQSKDLDLPAVQRNIPQTDWLVLILLIALTLIATIRNNYAKYLGQLFRSVLNYPISARMFIERNYPLIHGAIRLELYFYLIMSVFLFQVLNSFQNIPDMNNIYLFLVCLVIVLIYYFLKKALYSIIGFINEGKQEFSEMLFNLTNYNRILGLFLFPIVAIIGFSQLRNPQIPLFMGIILIGVFYLLFLLRASKILLKNQFSIHYLFLYLCTLEILPLVLIGKLVLT